MSDKPELVELELGAATPDIIHAVLKLLMQETQSRVAVPYTESDSSESLITRVRTGMSRARKSARAKLGSHMRHFKLGTEVDEVNRIVYFWPYQSKSDFLNEKFLLSGMPQ